MRGRKEFWLHLNFFSYDSANLPETWMGLMCHGGSVIFFLNRSFVGIGFPTPPRLSSALAERLEVRSAIFSTQQLESNIGFHEPNRKISTI